MERWVLPGVPSDHYGGHGSLVVADGRVILSLVWHRDQPTEKREITRKVLSDMGHRSTGALGADLVAKMEADRLGLSRRMRGKALTDYANQWVDEHITDEKTKLALGSWVASRFKKGASALPIAVLDEVAEKSKHVFANQAELDEWIASRDWTDAQKAEILSKIPATEVVANDVVLALDAETGAEIWRYEVEGSPSGRGSCSTPSVHGGRVYAALSGHIYCLDAEAGELVWRSELDKKGPASSPLVTEDLIFLNQSRLTAYDTATGEVRWENKDVKTANSSPALWGGTLICNSSKALLGIDTATGETRWTLPGGGDSTPVVAGEHLVVTSKTDDANLLAYRLVQGAEPELLWQKGFVARRYGGSPIVYGGHVYHLGSAHHWCVDLATGEIAWQRDMQSSISSPILADGKLMVYENRGGLLAMIEATPDDYNVLGKAKVGALYCASPAIVGRDIYYRTKDSVRCVRLVE